MGIHCRSIAITTRGVSPTETGEGKRAVEARVAVHEGILLVVADRRFLQVAVAVVDLRQLTIRHGEEVDHRLRGRIATTTCVARTDVALPAVVLDSVTVTREVDQRIEQGEEHSLRILVGNGKHLGKRRSIRARVALAIQAVAASVDSSHIGLHGLVSRLVTLHILLTVEQRAAPECQHTTLQSQCRTRGDTTVVRRALPSTIDGERTQQLGRLVQIGNDELEAILGAGTLCESGGTRFEHRGHDGHTTIPLHHLIVRPGTEEVGLTQQLVLLLLRQCASLDTDNGIVDVTHSTIDGILHVTHIGTTEVVGHLIGRRS